MTPYEKIASLCEAKEAALYEHNCQSCDAANPDPNPLCGVAPGVYIPLWLSLLPENSEEVRLPKEVNDLSYSSRGDAVTSIMHDPRAGFFERADALSEAYGNSVDSLSLNALRQRETRLMTDGSSDEDAPKTDSSSAASPVGSVSSEPASSGSPASAAE